MSLRKPLVPITDYKEPVDSASSLELASSIVSGKSSDGGIRSITYKSIYAAQLTEELDIARRAVVPGESQLTKIVDKTYASAETVSRLKAEVERLRKGGNIGGSTTDSSKKQEDDISVLNTELEQDVRASKAVSKAVSQKLAASVRAARGLNSKYVVRKLATPSGVKNMEDVPGFDASMYARAVERRLQETQQKIEQERYLIEQQAQQELQQQELQQQELQKQVQQQQQQELQQELELQQQGLQQQQFQPPQSEIEPLGLVEEPSMDGMEDSSEHSMQIPEPSLEEFSYAMDSEASMAPSYTDAYVPQPQITDHLPPMPQMDASYLQGSEQ